MGKCKVVVVGCGLAGSLLANGLARHDVDFEIYDRLSEDTVRDGYQIRLGENALIGMRACLTPEQIREIVSLFGCASDKSEAPVIIDKDWNALLDLSTLPNYSKSAPINRVLLRDALCRPLKASGRLRQGKKFTGFDILNPGTPEEQVRAFFDDGTSTDCDLLIAADGNQSRANKDIGLNNIVTLDTHACFLTKNELPLAAYRSLPKELLASPILTTVGNVTFYWCAYLPKKFHEGSSGQDEVDQADYNEELGSCMLGVSIPVECLRGQSVQSLDDATKYDLISACFEGWSPIFNKALEFCKDQGIYAYQARCGLDVPLNWREKVATSEDAKKGNPRVWLLGDAIHPMTPNRGMGGNTAMRDTAEILPIIVALQQTAEGSSPLTTAAIRDACHKYEKDMIPRAFEWVRKSGRTITPFDSSNRLTRLGFYLASWAIPILKFGLSIVGNSGTGTFAEAAELTTR